MTAIKKLKIIRLDKNGVSTVTVKALFKKAYTVPNLKNTNELKKEVIAKFRDYFVSDDSDYVLSLGKDDYIFYVNSQDLN